MRTNRWALCLALVTIAALSGISSANAATGSAGGRPVSLPAVEAMAKCHHALAAARKMYLRAAIHARKKELAALKKAEEIAVKANNMGEFSRIENVVLQAQSQLQADVVAMKLLSATGLKKTVFANQPWQTMIHVHRGDTVKITAHGRWNCYGTSAATWSGPNGRMSRSHPGQRWYYLEGRIGVHEIFSVGSRYQAICRHTGTLYLQMKDTNLSDNTGKMAVTIWRVPTVDGTH